MTVTLTLPALVGGRDLATTAVARLGEIADTDVVVDARSLVSGTSSFAGQLVHDVLSTGRARSLAVVGAPADFNNSLTAAADSLTVASQLLVTRDMPVADGQTAHAS
ncbi:MAG: hypothetical protein ACR2KJ_08890 [Jatrophihabitans sp.]